MGVSYPFPKKHDACFERNKPIPRKGLSELWAVTLLLSLICGLRQFRVERVLSSSECRCLLKKPRDCRYVDNHGFHW